MELFPYDYFEFTVNQDPSQSTHLNNIYSCFYKVNMGAHADPKLYKRDAMWYTGILIYMVGYQYHEAVNFEIKKLQLITFN